MHNNRQPVIISNTTDDATHPTLIGRLGGRYNTMLGFE